MNRYTDEELTEFGIIINTKLELAEASLARFCKELGELDPDTKSFEDNAEQTIMKEDLTRMALRQEKLVNELKAAMQRVKSKTYGICTISNKLIPKDRLKAIPQATTIIGAIC